MYYRARFYDPQVGRFSSEDPIGFNGGDINLYAYVTNDPINFRDPSGRQRSDRDRPGDIEWARGLKKQIDRMPTQPSNCGCQSNPRTPLLLAGTVAVLDGPQPGPADAVGLLLLLAGLASTPPVDCTPPRVGPFPRAVPNPTPKAVPTTPPPPPPGGRDCTGAYEACLGWANQGRSPSEQRMRRRMCSQTYQQCKDLDITVKFPNGSVVR